MKDWCILNNKNITVEWKLINRIYSPCRQINK
jgi:hypothetical protein